MMNYAQNPQDVMGRIFQWLRSSLPPEMAPMLDSHWQRIQQGYAQMQAQPMPPATQAMPQPNPWTQPPVAQAQPMPQTPQPQQATLNPFPQFSPQAMQTNMAPIPQMPQQTPQVTYDNPGINGLSFMGRYGG